MKKVLVLMIVVIAASTLALAQMQNPTSDVLGAHLNYGRGCAACHAPHSGARGSGITTLDTASGDVILWGQDVYPLLGKTYHLGWRHYRSSAQHVGRQPSGYHRNT